MGVQIQDGFFNNLNPNNVNYNQLETLITPQRLRETYLFGIQAIDDSGTLLGDDAIQTFINNAISLIEHDLDIAVMPRQIQENKDYYANDYWDWGFLQLNRTPVLSVDELKVVYLKNQTALEDVLDIPPEWIRFEPVTGILRLIPNNKFPSRLQVDASGAFFPELFQRYSMIPELWLVKYTYGFPEGGIPSILNAAIGLLAAIFYMNQAADLTLGAGIASTSISLDGLSQGIVSTASAENTTFSARVKEFNRLLYGDKQIGSTGIIPALRAYYKNTNTMNII